MKLLTADEMRELDRRTIEEVGIPGVILMEHAGAAAARIFAERFTAFKPGPVLVLAGKGNNGGDGYVIALYPAESPRLLLLVCVHGVPGAEAAVTVGRILRVATDGT